MSGSTVQCVSSSKVKRLEGAIFIGFTGTPLLRKDKQMTQDVFGTYIRTYKFHEGVADGAEGRVGSIGEL
jgi:type I site-specific restriction-modification system R (restriction) subunit